MNQFSFDRFPDPYRDQASLAVPLGFRRVLRWSEQAWLANNAYAKAIERKAAYFLTKIETKADSDEESAAWQAVLDKVLYAGDCFKLGCIDSHCYGAGFVTLVVPFHRFLACPKCRFQMKLRELAEFPGSEFQWRIPNFIARCRCGYMGPWEVVDRLRDVENKLALKRWSPHEMEIVHNLETGANRTLWRIPATYRAQLRATDCDLFHLERTNKWVLEAIATDQLYEFHEDAIFQFIRPALGGLELRGWGLPDPVANHRRLFILQVFRRQSEALGLDYVVPIRLITPAPRAGAGGVGGGIGSDPYFGQNSSNTERTIRRMIHMHRLDPASIHVSAVPLQYQVLGAEAKQYIPLDLIEFEEKGLLNDSGLPVDLWQGSLQLQAAPVALRLAESAHSDVPLMYNKALQWLSKSTARVLSRPPADLTMQRVTVADDIERHAINVQLMMAGKLAESDVLRELGHDFKRTQQRLGEDAVTAAREQARTQELLNEAGLAQQIVRGQPAGGQAGGPGGAAPPGSPQGAAPAGGDPAQPGGMTPALASYMSGSSAPQNMDDMTQASQMIASELIQKSDAERYTILQQLRKSNEPLHRLVMGDLKNIRSQVRSQAGAVAIAGMQQGGQQAPALR